MTQTDTAQAASRLAAAVDSVDYSGLTVRPEYIDPNGHMNVGYYGVMFDKASDLPCALLELGWDMIERFKITAFTLENHITFQHEVLQGDPLTFDFHLLDHDAKRLHFVMTMRHATEGWVAATCESISMCIDIATRRPTSWPAEVTQKLALLRSAHALRPAPKEVGRIIGIRRQAAG